MLCSHLPPRTVCEQSSYRDTGDYNEVLRFCKQLERRAPFLRRIDLGPTPEGRPLALWTVSRAGNARSGRPVILIQNCVHAGETAGKDATLLLLRDLALGRFPLWLDRCILLILPVFNVDGHENRSPAHRANQNGPPAVGSRVTAQRLNLNRDYMKADAPEMRAWLRLYNEWLPDLLIDNHTSNGLDFQYDITFHLQTRQMVWKTVADWNRELRRTLERKLFADGHITGPYFEIEDPSEFEGGLRLEFRTPGYSWGYANVQNRSAIVAESHSLKPYRAQVLAHYDLMRHAIDTVCGEPAALTRAVRAADRAVAARPTRLFLDGTFTATTKSYIFKGLAVSREPCEITGAPAVIYQSTPVDIPVAVFERVKTTVAPRLPSAYLVPPQWTAVIELLRLHGVRTRPLKRALSGEFETYRFTGERWEPETVCGRHRVTFDHRLVRVIRTVPAGWIHVPMNQRAARVALNLLEPGGPESLIRWGFFDTIFEQTEYMSDHLLIPLARRMLASSAALRAEFERRLADDPSFRDSPAARLDFFYWRSSYAETAKNLYPVLRLRKS